MAEGGGLSNAAPATAPKQPAPKPTPQPARAPALASSEAAGPSFRAPPTMLRAPPPPMTPLWRSWDATLYRKCSTCEDEAPKLQAKAGPDCCADEVPASVRDVVAGGGGRPLEPDARAFFEPRFGRSFGDVRVHTDGRAGVSACDVGAEAYTAGSNIVFAPGRYDAKSPQGQKLLAHELAHVAQGSPGASSELPTRVSRPDEPAERAADALAARALSMP